MATLKVEVKDGRVTIDEPTDLPDGTVLELVKYDPVYQAAIAVG